MFKENNNEFIIGSLLVAGILFWISKSSPAGAWIASTFGTVSNGFLIILGVLFLIVFGGSIIGAILKFFQD